VSNAVNSLSKIKTEFTTGFSNKEANKDLENSQFSAVVGVGLSEWVQTE
jgi:hypothetical protein